MTVVNAVEVASTSTNQKPSNGETLITAVLDETGSMGQCWDSTISSVNEYMGSQKTAPGVAHVNLFKFSKQYGWRNGGRGISATNALNIQSSNFRIVFENTLVNDVPELTRENFIPNGDTNLYDAIGMGIHAVAAQLAPMESVPDVLFVIITDGGENASSEYNLDSIKELVKAKEAEGWTFVYLGANQDAWKVGSSFGLSKGQTMSYSTADMAGTMSTLSESTHSYRALRSSGTVARGSVTKDFFGGDEEKA